MKALRCLHNLSGTPSRVSPEAPCRPLQAAGLLITQPRLSRCTMPSTSGSRSSHHPAASLPRHHAVHFRQQVFSSPSRVSPEAPCRPLQAAGLPITQPRLSRGTMPSTSGSRSSHHPAASLPRHHAVHFRQQVISSPSRVSPEAPCRPLQAAGLPITQPRLSRGTMPSTSGSRSSHHPAASLPRHHAVHFRQQVFPSPSRVSPEAPCRPLQAAGLPITQPRLSRGTMPSTSGSRSSHHPAASLPRHHAVHFRQQVFPSPSRVSPEAPCRPLQAAGLRPLQASPSRVSPEAPCRPLQAAGLPVNWKDLLPIDTGYDISFDTGNMHEGWPQRHLRLQWGCLLLWIRHIYF